MTTYQFIFPEYAWDVQINWSAPVSHFEFTNGKYLCDMDSYVYLITAKYYKEKILYIGKTYSQFVTDRIHQSDHIGNILQEFNEKSVFIRHGSITIHDGKRTKYRIDEIESILIYAHWTEDMYNRNKIQLIKVVDTYKIKNTGNIGPLKKSIGYGVFETV